MGFENRRRELLPILSSDQPFASDVKQERVVVVEFIQGTALFSCYDTIACICVCVCFHAHACVCCVCVCCACIVLCVYVCGGDGGGGDKMVTKIEIGQLYE